MENEAPYEVGYGKPPKAHQFKRAESNPAPSTSPTRRTLSHLLREYGNAHQIDFVIRTVKDGQAREISGRMENGKVVDTYTDASGKTTEVKGTINDLIGAIVIKNCLEGDIQFIQFYADRTEGKAPQTLHVHNKGRRRVTRDEKGNVVIQRLDKE